MGVEVGNLTQVYLGRDIIYPYAFWPRKCGKSANGFDQSHMLDALDNLSGW